MKEMMEIDRYPIDSLKLLCLLGLVTVLVWLTAIATVVVVSVGWLAWPGETTVVTSVTAVAAVSTTDWNESTVVEVAWLGDNLGVVTNSSSVAAVVVGWLWAVDWWSWGDWSWGVVSTVRWSWRSVSTIAWRSWSWVATGTTVGDLTTGTASETSESIWTDVLLLTASHVTSWVVVADHETLLESTAERLAGLVNDLGEMAGGTVLGATTTESTSSGVATALVLTTPSVDHIPHELLPVAATGLACNVLTETLSVVVVVHGAASTWVTSSPLLSNASNSLVVVEWWETTTGTVGIVCLKNNLDLVIGKIRVGSVSASESTVVVNATTVVARWSSGLVACGCDSGKDSEDSCDSLELHFD